MIGLKLPRLFYGQKKREIVVGVRADFCEFCIAICRHWVVSFQAAPTVLFIPFRYEEFQRESCCEICRAPFPLALDARFQKLPKGRQMSIKELMGKTHPGVLERALIEVEQMLKRSAMVESNQDCLLEQNRISNFVQRHESEYQRCVRDFLPFVAVASIQASILGLALTAIVPSWLAISFTASLLILGTLSILLVIRKRISALFDGAIERILAVTDYDREQLESQIHRVASRFPHSANILHRQLARLSPDDRLSFAKDNDFLPLLDRLAEIPEL